VLYNTAEYPLVNEEDKADTHSANIENISQDPLLIAYSTALKTDKSQYSRKSYTFITRILAAKISKVRQ